MLIGSANLTQAAFISNVEASVLVEEADITSDALKFFEYLWSLQNSSQISLDEISSLEKTVKERKVFKKKSIEIRKESNSDDESKIKVLLEYTKGWIDIPKYENTDISSIWRGWYIIPDQGLIDDTAIQNLKSYLPYVHNGISLNQIPSNRKYKELLEKFAENSQFRRTNLKMRLHDLFVRQAKNYLIKMGWCNHPIKSNGKLDKKALYLTELGKQVDRCDNLKCVKTLYTDYFNNYLFNGLTIIQFSRKLLQRLDYLTQNEFNYFVTHAYHDDDLETIVNLVQVYRSLSNPSSFDKKFREYFEEKKGITANGVYTNHTKNIRHTMSVIGWCEGFSFRDGVLRLVNGN